MGDPRKIAKLGDHHREFLRLRVASWRYKDIAEALGYSAALVRAVCTSELGKAELARLHRMRDKNAALAGIVHSMGRLPGMGGLFSG